MKVLKEFFKVKETYFGVLASIAFPVIFFIIWLTAYDGVFDRVDKLQIALVNEDLVVGEAVASEITGNKALNIVVEEDLAVAKKAMDARDYNMIIHIPESFSSQIETAGETEINYYINQSNPALSKQAMETIAAKVTEEVNRKIFTFVQGNLAESVSQGLAKSMANPELINGVIMPIMEQIGENTVQFPVQAEIIKTNNNPTFAATMIPLLVVLASYIGAMLLSQHLQFSEEKLRQTHSAWALFFARQMINFVVTLVLATLIVGLLLLFKTEIEQSIAKLWAFQFLLFFCFISLSQIFVIAFKNPGMIFNIALVASQLVSSGAIVPPEMLSGLYQKLGSILPGTYGVNGYFSMVYGGGNIASDVVCLLIIVGVTLFISAAIVMIRGVFAAKIVQLER